MSVTRLCTHKGKFKSALLGLGLLATCAFAPVAWGNRPSFYHPIISLVRYFPPQVTLNLTRKH